MPNKNLIRFSIVALLAALFAAIWVSTDSLIIAQSDPVPLPDSTVIAPTQDPDQPDGPPILEMSEEQRAAEEAAIATQNAEFLSRNILDYRIAYLIAEDTEIKSEMVLPETITNQLGAQVFNSWEAFAAENKTQPFQIILIHASVFDQIDLESTHHAYRNRIVLVGIDFTHPQLKAMTGNQCLSNMNPHLKDSDFTATFKYSTYVVTAPPELIEVINEAELVSCTEYDAGGKTTGVMRGQVDSSLEKQTDLDFLIGSLLTKVRVYGFNKELTAN